MRSSVTATTHHRRAIRQHRLKGFIFWVIIAALVVHQLQANGVISDGDVAVEVPGADRIQYASNFEASGQTHGVDPALLAAMAEVESTWNLEAVSRGARGLMQIMPATAAAECPGADLFNPAEAIDCAARYTATSQAELGTTDPVLLAAAYHAGRGAVLRAGGVPQRNSPTGDNGPGSTQYHVDKVMEAMNQ